VTLTFDLQDEWRCRGRHVVTIYQVWLKHLQPFCLQNANSGAWRSQSFWLRVLGRWFLQNWNCFGRCTNTFLAQCELFLTAPHRNILTYLRKVFNYKYVNDTLLTYLKNCTGYESPKPLLAGHIQNKNNINNNDMLIIYTRNQNGRRLNTTEKKSKIIIFSTGKI